MISKASKVLNSEASFGGGDFDTIHSKAKSQFTSNNGNSKIKSLKNDPNVVVSGDTTI